MNWLYDTPELAPHTIDVETYDNLGWYAKRAVERLLENHDIDLKAVFLIEIVPGKAKIRFYDTDEEGNRYVDEDGELAISKRVVYDRGIQKAIYYDLDGEVHQSLVYNG